MRREAVKQGTVSTSNKRKITSNDKAKDSETSSNLTLDKMKD
jgi:hypothetical protein